MIDFLSTREGCTEETRRAARLLAAVIVEMLRKAGTRPTRVERAMGLNEELDARIGIDYLFGANSTFELHIETLGGSAVTMREALLSDRKLDNRFGFTEELRHNIQTRHRWWRREKECNGTSVTCSAE